MSMQRKTWTISGLAVEFDTDRRTVAKWLQDLPPAESRQIGNRTERRWYLSAVIDHLKGKNFRRQRTREDIEAEKILILSRFIRGDLFRAIVDSRSFEGIMLHGFADDMELSKEQREEIYSVAVMALAYSLCDVLDEQDAQIDMPPEAAEILRRVGDRRRANGSANGGTDDAP